MKEYKLREIPPVAITISVILLLLCWIGVLHYKANPTINPTVTVYVAPITDQHKRINIDAERIIVNGNLYGGFNSDHLHMAVVGIAAPPNIDIVVDMSKISMGPGIHRADSP